MFLNRLRFVIACTGFWQTRKRALLHACALGGLMFLTTVSVKADCTSAAPNLTAWWPGDGNANNLFGTNNGTLQGGATASGVGLVGNAFSFDGTNGFVQIADSPMFHPTNLTIEAWVRFSGLDSAGSGAPAGIQYMVFKQNSRSGGFEGFVLNKARTGSGDVFQFVVTSSAGIAVTAQSTSLVSTGVWYHVAGVRGSNFVQIYVNGVMEQQLPVGFPQDYGTLPLYFGTTGQFWDRKLKGNLDEVSLYDRPLGSNEIAAIYAAGASGKCKGPNIITQPQGQSVFAGTNVNFTVAATGLGPLAYQWRFNGTLLSNGGRFSGATTPTLSVTNLQLSDSGDYSVVVSNIAGVVTSAVATLTVKPVTCSAVPSGLAGWWTGDGHSFDSAGTNHATLLNGATFATGKVGQGFSFDGVDDRVVAGDSPAWRIGTNDFTIEGWIQAFPASRDFGVMAIFEKQFAFSSDTAVGVQLYLQDGKLALFMADGPLQIQAFSTFVSAGPNLHDGQFHYVAASVQRQSATGGKLYVDGQLVLTFDPTIEPGDLSTAEPVRIGNHANLSLNCYFKGVIDEISVYDRALTASEVQTIFDARDLGKCPLPPSIVQSPQSVPVAVGNSTLLGVAGTGSQPLAYQWYFGGNAMIGATSSALSLANVQLADAGSYFAVVTNSSGFATTAVAVVQVGAPPSFALSPVAQTGIIGGTVHFDAAVAGDGPISYQWLQNNIALAEDARHFGVNTTNLTITNLVAGDAANYSLRASNLFGSITSAAVSLTILGPPVFSTQPSGASVPLGQWAILNANASGTAPLRYQWLLNNLPVPGATNQSLTLSNLVAANFGDYQMVVTNVAGSVTSVVARLTVGPVAMWGTHSLAAAAPLFPAAGLSNVISIGAGSGYSLALRGDGTVYGWGVSSSPSLVNMPPGLSGIVAIAAGNAHVLALRTNGTLMTWGQSGFNLTNIPAGLSNVIAIAAGSSHSVALRSDGTVFAWGQNSNGQTNTPPGLIKVEALDAGGSYAVAIREGGKLAGWGGTADQKIPPPLPEGSNFYVSASAGLIHNLALTDQGRVVAWGGTFRGSDPATNIPPSVTNIIAVEAAGGFDQTSGASIVLRSNGTVFAWGNSGNSIITNIPGNISNGVALAGSVMHAMTLVNDGRPLIVRPPVGGTFYTGRELRLRAHAVGQAPLRFQWFKNGSALSGATNESLVLAAAQFGDAGDYRLIATNSLGVAQSLAVPVSVVDSPPILFSQPAARIAYHGSPFSVGASVAGSGPLQLDWTRNGISLPDHTNELMFDRALPTQAGNYQLVASNPFGAVTSSIAPVTFRRAFMWASTVITNLPVDFSNVVAVAAGANHVLALRPDGTVAAWGTVADNSTNVPSGLSNVTAVAGGNGFSVALKSDGKVTAWGVNSLGQTNVPLSLSNVIAISAGEGHVLALRENGTVAAWGSSASGQAGVPATLSNVVAISAGRRHSLALRNDGTIVGWGFLGTIPPVASNVVAITAGYDQSLALQADGTLRPWSSSGSPPALPAGLSNVVAIGSGGITAGFLQSVALRNDGTVVAWGTGFAPQYLLQSDIMSGVSISPGGNCMLLFLNDRSPFVTAQTSSRRLNAGTNVTLAALAVGQPTLSCQWRFGATNIPGATNPALTLTGLSRAASGDYQAVVSNGLGATNSRTIHLDVGGSLVLLPGNMGASGLVSFGVGDSFGAPLGAGDISSIGVLASSNLVNWQVITNAVIITNGTLRVQDAFQTNFPTRYYRLFEQ